MRCVFLFLPVLLSLFSLFCSQGSEIIPIPRPKRLVIWSIRLKFNHLDERYEEASSAMERRVKAKPVKRVNGSPRTKVIAEKTSANAISSQLIFAGILPVDLTSKNPFERHRRTKIGKEIPGTFSQNNRLKTIPISNDTGTKFFFFIIHHD